MRRATVIDINLSAIPPALRVVLWAAVPKGYSIPDKGKSSDVPDCTQEERQTIVSGLISEQTISYAIPTNATPDSIQTDIEGLWKQWQDTVTNLPTNKDIKRVWTDEGWQ